LCASRLPNKTHVFGAVLFKIIPEKSGLTSRIGQEIFFMVYNPVKGGSYERRARLEAILCFKVPGTWERNTEWPLGWPFLHGFFNPPRVFSILFVFPFQISSLHHNKNQMIKKS
jgi:hypothetical protein